MKNKQEEIEKILKEAGDNQSNLQSESERKRISKKIIESLENNKRQNFTEKIIKK
jgi:hypothetical protein